MTIKTIHQIQRMTSEEFAQEQEIYIADTKKDQIIAHMSLEPMEIPIEREINYKFKV